MQYDVIPANSLADLIEAVRAAIADGFKPLGGVVCSARVYESTEPITVVWFYQAIVKE